MTDEEKRKIRNEQEKQHRKKKKAFRKFLEDLVAEKSMRVQRKEYVQAINIIQSYNSRNQNLGLSLEEETSGDYSQLMDSEEIRVLINKIEETQKDMKQISEIKATLKSSKDKKNRDEKRRRSINKLSYLKNQLIYRILVFENLISKEEQQKFHDSKMRKYEYKDK
eukprot:snap_masked-scaffold_84-processed-gene-0.28-mRNA-1 protein AED:1.00 eAED:1.00 QI:0/-1/0/0/-1/1/1/0/165